MKKFKLKAVIFLAECLHKRVSNENVRAQAIEWIVKSELRLIGMGVKI